MKTKGGKCFYCQEESHFIKESPKRLNDKKNKPKIDVGATLAYNYEANIDEVYVVVNSIPLKSGFLTQVAHFKCILIESGLLSLKM